MASRLPKASGAIPDGQASQVAGATVRMPVNRRTGESTIDTIELEPYGVIRVCGWNPGKDLPGSYLRVAGKNEHPRVVYRVARPDVARVLGISATLDGFAIEFFGNPPREAFEIVVGDIHVPITAEQAAVLVLHPPHYASFLDTPQVLHREDIYGSGPPNAEVHPDIFQLALLLKPPILDFGCGSGALIRQFRQNNIESSGIEIDREEIRNSLTDDVRPFIRLYNGSLPLPYRDRQFESVFATEVIEHVDDYKGVIRELARICRSAVGITVPDIQCIPIGHIHGVVPWHLLEATHINFFNFHSLTKTVEAYFDKVTLFRLAEGRVNGSYLPGSVGLIAEK